MVVGTLENNPLGNALLDNLVVNATPEKILRHPVTIFVPTDAVHLFEAAIDLLSYATYLKCEGKDYKAENLLSLSGVYQPKKELKESKIPVALTTFLKANPQIKTIFLHLDKDRAGRLCTAALKERRVFNPRPRDSILYIPF